MTSFNALLWALTIQESGGNYGAVGPPTPYGRAYGRYQVLAPNVGPWTQKYYGRRLTASQFLRNKKAQDAVVRGVLYGYYKRYGARGAAAMWYSGQPNPNKTYGNPPVYSYVNSVVGRAGRYNGQWVPGGGGGGGGGGSAGRATPKLDRAELAEQYGLSARLINSNKELRRLFNSAVEGQWSAARFTAKLRNTKWWRTQPSSLRKYLTMKYSDPATWKQKQRHAMAALNAIAVEVGFKSQLNGGKGTWMLREAVRNKLAWGWTDDRIRDWFGSRVRVHGGKMFGEAGEAFDKLHEIAYLNGMQYGGWYETAARAIVAGRSTLEREEAKIRRDAAARYKAFAEQIRAGQNVMDLAAPYIKSMATLWEIPETDVGLQNKYMSAAMRGDEAGSKYPLWKFENQLRSDPRWRRTNNAREGMMSTARQVAKDFGMGY